MLGFVGTTTPLSTEDSFSHPEKQKLTDTIVAINTNFIFIDSFKDTFNNS